MTNNVTEDEATEYKTIDLDTADALLGELATNVVPWINLAERLHKILEIAKRKNLLPAEYLGASEVLDRVIIYINTYCCRVVEKINQDRYRMVGK